MIQIDYRDSRPIYEQVRDAFRRQIIAGVLQPGDKMPSVRELAVKLAVNPNTIQRAYRELEQEGCICSVKGKGSVVAEATEAAETRKAQLLEAFDNAAAELMALGVSPRFLAERVDRSEK